MEKSIFNVYVVMDSQETCDRMKQLCIDNGLNYFKNDYAFCISLNNINKVFEYDTESNSFYVSSININDIQVTETEFIELLKTTK